MTQSHGHSWRCSLREEFRLLHHIQQQQQPLSHQLWKMLLCKRLEHYPSPAGSSISLGKGLGCWDFWEPVTLHRLFQLHCSPETPTGARGCTRTQKGENPSLVQLGTETGGGQEISIHCCLVSSQIGPKPTIFFSNFPVNWTFQRTVEKGERGHQGGLEEDADFASSSMMSRLAGGAGA